MSSQRGDETGEPRQPSLREGELPSRASEASRGRPPETEGAIAPLGLAPETDYSSADLAEDSDDRSPPPPPEGRAARRRRLALTIAKRSAVGLLALVLVGVASVIVVVRHYEAGLPSVAQLKAGYEPPQVTRILARDGTLLGTWFTERRTVIQLKDVPNHVKLAFLAAEDAHFYEHEGLNYLGMLRALVANLRAGETRQGGSTITQQVVKNVLLDAERSYQRKIRETILARRLEQNLSKDEIFGLYLNQIWFGHGRYGVEEAARYYFGKSAREIDLAEAAMLAGLVAAPARYSPRISAERALERRHYVLHQMLLKGFVTAELFRQADETPLRLAPALELEAELAPEIVSYARRVLQQLVGDRAQRGGFVVTTTIDPQLQAVARQAVRANLKRYAERQKLAPPYTLERRRLWGPVFEGRPRPHRIYVGTVVALDDRLGTIDVRVGTATGRVFLGQSERYNSKRLPPSQFTRVGAILRVAFPAAPEQQEGLAPLRLELGPQAALVGIDVRTREVRALVGSYEALPGGLDRATRARRQPGSAFKPFVYSYALHSRRFSPASVLSLPDAKSEGGTRQVTVRRALAASDNAASEYILEAVGAANVVQWARAAGIESKLEPTPSLALGAYEVTPLEIANAYATFASGGTFAPPVLITKIVGPDGRPLELPPAPPTRSVLQPDEAYLTTSLLCGVVQTGTARRAKALGRPVAGKTGTTNDAKDAWFVGYSPELVAAVWVGYDDALPLGSGEQGAVTALPAWVDFMGQAHEGMPATNFPRPSSILLARVDPATGLLPFEGQQETVEEEFLNGSVPTEAAVAPDPADGGLLDQPQDAGADPGADAGPEPTVVPPPGAAPGGTASGPNVDEPPPF